MSNANDPMLEAAEVAYQELLSDALNGYWGMGNDELPLRSSLRMQAALVAVSNRLEAQLPDEAMAPLLRRALLQAIGMLRGPVRCRPPAAVEPTTPEEA